MGTTIPGGFYLDSKGRAKDAHGNFLGYPLEETFPAREELTEAGYRTDKQVEKATDEELRSIEGIGPATIEDIRKATGQWEEPEPSENEDDQEPDDEE